MTGERQAYEGNMSVGERTEQKERKMDSIKIARINELARKQKTEGLEPEEAMEQAVLRREYIEAIKANLRGSLDSMKIQNPDGSIIDVKKRREEKMKK